MAITKYLTFVSSMSKEKEIEGRTENGFKEIIVENSTNLAKYINLKSQQAK